MVGPCLCGDVNCPSCGSAMGHNPEFERLCEWLEGVLLFDLPPYLDENWVIEEMGERFAKAEFSEEFREAVMAEIRRWEQKQKEKRYSTSVL